MARKYVKKHTQAIMTLEQSIPGAIDAVAEAKVRMDKALRSAKQRKAYLTGQAWLPKQTMRIKELEDIAAYYGPDREGKMALQTNIESVLGMAALADKWSKGGYVTFEQIKFMANKLGIDENELINYNLFQMKDAIAKVYRTGMTAEEKEEFGYVELEYK